MQRAEILYIPIGYTNSGPLLQQNNLNHLVTLFVILMLILGTSTMINIWTIHHKEDHYKDPYDFQPSRFLDETGNLLPSSKTKHFFAFSMGPRQCLGQSLAESEIFLYLANILHKFQLSSPVPVEQLLLHGTTKVTHAPNKYSILIKRRLQDHLERFHLYVCMYL